MQALNLTEIVGEALVAVSTSVLDLTHSQRLHGFNSDGTRIGTYASGEYAAMKYQQNPLAGEGNIDLERTSAFNVGAVLNVNTDTYELTSTDSKTDMLVQQYGDKMLGLSAESKDTLITEELQSAVVSLIREKTGAI